jgi:hypothetical protein
MPPGNATLTLTNHQRVKPAIFRSDLVWLWGYEHLPAPKTSGLYETNCHIQGRFRSDLSVPDFQGGKGALRFKLAHYLVFIILPFMFIPC